MSICPFPFPFFFSFAIKPNPNPTHIWLCFTKMQTIVPLFINAIISQFQKALQTSNLFDQLLPCIEYLYGTTLNYVTWLYHTTTQCTQNQKHIYLKQKN